MIKYLIKKVFVTLSVFLIIIFQFISFGTKDTNKLSVRAENEPTYAVDKKINDQIEAVWSDLAPYLKMSMNNTFQSGSPYSLYDNQVYTKNLLRYAILTHNNKLIDEIVSLYSESFKYLQVKDGYREWLCDTPTCKAWSSPSLQHNEVKLVTAQFLFSTADLIDYISGLSDGEITTNMHDFVLNFNDLIQNDYINRWIFGQNNQLLFVYNSGCNDNVAVDHLDHIQRLLINTPNKYKYCTAVTDTDTFIITMAMKMLSADNRNHELINMPLEMKDSLIQYSNLGSRLIQSRLSEKNLSDFSSQNVAGLNFDLGASDDHPEYKYTGYTGSDYPGGDPANNIAPMPENRASNVGWDISHARRLVEIFETLNETKDLIGETFPNQTDLAKLANQLIYGAYNKDINNPLFSNFMDSTNGWYRVDYSVQGFGYAPYDLSVNALTSGGGFWSSANKDIETTFRQLWSQIENSYVKSDVNFTDGIIHKTSYRTDGKNGNAMYFDGVIEGDGSEHYVESLRNNLYASPQGTVSLWFKPDQFKNMDLFNIFQDGFSNYMVLRMYQNTSMRLLIKENNVFNTDLNIPTNLSADTWYHLAIAQNGTGIQIYLNGQEIATSGINSSNWFNHFSEESRVWLGRGHWQMPYSGMIDDFAIYSRALSSAEVQSQYQNQAVGNDGLVLNWNFDQSIEQSKFDFIQKNYNLNEYSLLQFLPSIALHYNETPLIGEVSMGKRNIKRGEQITVTVKIKNTTANDYNNVVLESNLPKKTTYVENSASDAGAYDSGKITWTLPRLTVSEERTLTYKVMIE